MAPPTDIIARGVKRPSPAGTATFVGLRALDPVLQNQLLQGLGASFLAKLGLTAIPLSTAVVTRTGIKLIDQLGLPLERLLLLGMAVGSATKQIYWLTSLSQEEFPATTALAVSAYNTFCNSVNSLLFIAAATSASRWTKPFTLPLPGSSGSQIALPVAVGALLYAVGMVLETGSEYQRKKFKEDPAHKGKLCRTGLWAWARHINYGGYTLWRTGYALAAGGWIAGGVVALMQAGNFASSGTVNLDSYMSKKYKDQWGRYKEDVPWKLFPGIY